METIVGDLYDYPQYYDLVYGSDWKAEFDFLLDCFARYAKGDVLRVFEPACGTGRLLYRLARAGFDVSGLDLNEPSVRYCNQRLKRHGFSAAARVGDMTDFELPRSVDAAFNMINSFRHLPSDEAAASHLQCVARGLRPGGLYVLGLHLTPTRGRALEEEHWSARRGHLAVMSSVWTINVDRQQRRERVGMSYDVYTPTRQFRLANEMNFRTYTAAQFDELLARQSQLEVAAIHDFQYRTDVPIAIKQTTEDVVFVLRKK